MFLPINDQYRLTADSRCWMIEEKRPRKRKGEIRDEWTPIRFRLRTSEAQNVVEALAEIKHIAAELCEALRPMPHVITALQSAERGRAALSGTPSQ